MGYHQAMQIHIDAQVRYWKERKDAIEKVEFSEEMDKKNKPFITLSREYGVGAFGLGEKIVRIINEKYKSSPEWAAYDRTILDKLMNDLGLSESLAATLTDNSKRKMADFIQTAFSKFPPQVAVYRKLVEVVRTLAVHGNVVIVGRAGNVITRDMIKGFHVRVVAPMHFRAERISRTHNIKIEEAKKLVVEKDAKRDGFIKEYVKHDNKEPLNYHIVVNLGQMTDDEAAMAIVNSMQACGFL